MAARVVLIRLFCHVCAIRTVSADGGYLGTLIEWTRAMFNWTLTTVKRADTQRFTVSPKRWILECTFAWLGWARCLSKDYEVRLDSAETMIHLAFVHFMLQRLI